MFTLFSLKYKLLAVAVAYTCDNDRMSDILPSQERRDYNQTAQQCTHLEVQNGVNHVFVRGCLFLEHCDLIKMRGHFRHFGRTGRETPR
jgi:hypothetical protein